MDRTLHQVFLMASDVDASGSFYEEGLGFAVAERGERSVRFETGRCELMLEQDFEPETLGAFGMEPPGESRGDGVIVVVEVDDGRRRADRFAGRR
jgi:catechol 2,3-dioxygenase-like lactoylglutathione lyase family enzyme